MGDSGFPRERRGLRFDISKGKVLGEDFGKCVLVKALLPTIEREKKKEKNGGVRDFFPFFPPQ